MENKSVEPTPEPDSLTNANTASGTSSEVEKDKEENNSSEGGSLLGGAAVALERTRTDSVSSNSSSKLPVSASAVKDKDKDKDKINILLKPVGDAPILKQKLWAVPSERLVSQIAEFVKKYLKLEKHQNLFFFVNQLFAPAPDQCIRDLYECFGSDRKLVLHYSTTVAWG